MHRLLVAISLVGVAICAAPRHNLFGQTPLPTSGNSASESSEQSLERAARLIVEAGRLRGEGRFKEASAAFEEARQIRKRRLGERHPDYALCLHELGFHYRVIADFPRAEPVLIEALAIRKDILGVKHEDYAKSLNNLGGLYESMGEFPRAERLFLEARDVLKDAVGRHHPAFATCQVHLGSLYFNMGDYARAEPLFAEASSIRKAVQGPRDSEYADSLDQLAWVYECQSDFLRAEPLYLEVFSIRKEVYGDRHLYYAFSLNSLAGLYFRLGDLARAEPLYLEAREIYAMALGRRHPQYATLLNNLASLYTNQGDYARAEPLFLEAIEVYRAVYGRRHPYYAMCVGNLARQYRIMGDFPRAEQLYVEALAIRKESLGEFHPDYSQNLNDLAFVYGAMDHPEQAESLFLQGLRASRQSLDATAAVQSERQQLAMGQGLRHQLDAYVSFGLNNGRFARNVFQEELRWKGATLVRQRGMRLAVEDPAVAALFDGLQVVVRQLAQSSRVVPDKSEALAEWRSRLTELTAEKERLERALSAKSAALRNAAGVTLDDLLAALPSDAVLIDYLEFNRVDPMEKGKPAFRTRQIVAFIVRPDATINRQVAMVDLGAAAPVSAAIDRWRATFGVGDDAAVAALELRKLVWEPVLKSLYPDRRTTSENTSGTPLAGVPTADTATLLVSTDGVLGRLPLGALPGKKPGTYLIEDHRLAMVPVPQMLPALLNKAADRELDHELLVLGDVDYDAAPGSSNASMLKRKQPRRAGEVVRSPTDGRLFEPLAGTSAEVAVIKDLYELLFDAKPDDPRSLVRADANELQFRLLAPRYRHLHLATHGFFAGNQFQSADSPVSASLAALRRQRGPAATAESTSRSPTGDSSPIEVVGYNPGLLSGLALAGANREPTADADDGILTSQEISAMNLSGVDTVVLSACDTGLGETAGGEGLLGVQRAFQVAGARTTVASFWKVDDLVTRQLMERFYRNLWEKEMSRLDALREAQLHILNHPEELRGSDPQPADRLRTSPRYWAAFTLSGDWR